MALFISFTLNNSKSMTLEFTLNKQWFERAKAGSYRMYRSSNDKQDDDCVGRYFQLSMFD